MESKKTLNVRSLHHLLAIGATEFPSKELFRFEREGVDYSITYADFYSYVKSIARGFSRNGLGGRRVAIIGETSVEWIATYLATVISGGEIVPLDASLDREQIANFINLANCELFFYSNTHGDWIEENIEKMPNVKAFGRLTDSVFAPFLAEERPMERIGKLSDFAKTGAANPEIPLSDTDPEKMCALLFTSGTTGSSKGVMLSQKNICAVLNSAYKILHQISYDDVLLSVLPIHHTYEMSCGVLAPMMFGATVCINDSIKHISKNLKKYRPTVMALVPLFLEQFEKKIRSSVERQGKVKSFSAGMRLSHLLMKLRIDLRQKIFAQVREAFGGRLRYVVCGAAALKPELVDFFGDLGITVSQGYGITECAPLISVVPFDVYNPKSCGKVIDSMQVFIDKKSASDTYGEIVVKGDNVMLGYYQNQEATDEVLARGWFYTGDYGYLDANGYLYITGRKKNVIVLPGGKNVFPEEIEEYLARVELIEECVVLGREKDGDVIITALIYPNRTLAAEQGLGDEEALQAKLKEEVRLINRSLAGFKQIRRVEFRNEPFEKTSTRKIKRYKLS
ncbi:MAG: hypothetical protein E7620_00860 [Ruminococcaceae bacterium]|nr:hypothetical protein [Oscillospiraceae bacterium]